jgi:hypothetical protein
MKTTNIFLTLALLLSTFTFAQVGMGTTAPKGALDITSNTNGLVLPRVTNLNLVVNPQDSGAPVNGTMVYDVTASCTKTYQNGAWSACLGNINGFTHYLGEEFDGGIIYYLYKGSDGLEHGLIVALVQGTGQYRSSSTLTGANYTEDGAANTILMTNSSAKTYVATLGADWYLPSIDELGLLYYNRYSAQKGLRAGSHTLLPVSTTPYWSSTEYTSASGLVFGFLNGKVDAYAKNNTFAVRGIKAF